MKSPHERDTLKKRDKTKEGEEEEDVLTKVREDRPGSSVRSRGKK